jgi:hypothetical protein
MTRLGLASLLLHAACQPPPDDVVAHLPLALAAAHEAASHAEDPAALRAALALAYTDGALTRQLRDRWRGRLARGGSVYTLTEFEVEEVEVLAGSAQSADLDAAWRMAGTVLHEGHVHRRHLRARVRWEAVWTPDGWRIALEQPLEVLSLP